jgi:hypothetical protein
VYAGLYELIDLLGGVGERGLHQILVGDEGHRCAKLGLCGVTVTAALLERGVDITRDTE